MKALDKIYVSIRDLQYGYTTDVCLSQEEGYSAYIRKDALLEWANGWLAFKRSGVVLDDGFSYAMEELIKKLNEM